MKKIIAMILLLVSLFTLASCGGKKCDKCGEKITGESYNESVPGTGETMLYCEACHNELEEYKSGLSGILDMFN